MICPEPSALQELVRDLHRQATPWLPSGLGSRLQWSDPVPPAPGGSEPLVVSTRRLDQLLEHRRGDFTVTVQAGLPLAQLQAALAEANQWLALDWPWGSGAQGQGSGSVGGLVARGLAGGLRQRHLGVRDQVIGLSLMRADGTVARAGGQVVKNVAGYDLMRLLCGSWGSLGLITDVTLRTLPRPRHRSGLLLQGPAEALEPLRRLCLGAALAPQRLDWWTPALAHSEQPALLLALASISAAALNDQLEQLAAAATQRGLTVQQLPQEQLEALESRGGGSDAEPEAQGWLLQLGVLPAQAVELLGDLQRLNLACSLAAGAGLGLAWGPGAALADHQVEQLRRRCLALGGELIVLRQPASAAPPLPSWLDAPARPWIEAVKREFDPLQQLARGRLPGVQA
ncbi:glycolate oxidase [Cyanobium sp.]|nr:glycolate oxidase [Cyanobium sp.]